MEFLSQLQTEVKLLLVVGALALLGALLSATKRNEHRFMALFTVVMLAAGWRFQAYEVAPEVQARDDHTVVHPKGGSGRTGTR